MKNLTLTLLLALGYLCANAQMEELVIVEIDNDGLVKGKTYQFYVQVENQGDHVHLIFGDEFNQLIINTTEPFFQHELGGALSTNINAKIDSLDKSLKYDSYLTIGKTNSKNNSLNNFNLNTSGFEDKGEGFNTDNGAWYVTPDQIQAYAKEGNYHIMVMQLTTEGVISGSINFQGKDHKELLWRTVDLEFNSENSISEKEFNKMKKENLKAFKKTESKKPESKK